MRIKGLMENASYYQLLKTSESGVQGSISIDAYRIFPKYSSSIIKMLSSDGLWTNSTLYYVHIIYYHSNTRDNQEYYYKLLY